MQATRKTQPWLLTAYRLQHTAAFSSKNWSKIFI